MQIIIERKHKYEWWVEFTNYQRTSVFKVFHSLDEMFTYLQLYERELEQYR